MSRKIKIIQLRTYATVVIKGKAEFLLVYANVVGYKDLDGKAHRTTETKSTQVEGFIKVWLSKAAPYSAVGRLTPTQLTEKYVAAGFADPVQAKKEYFRQDENE